MRSAIAPLVLVAVAIACKSSDVPRTPEDLCARGCETQAKQCDVAACERGCNLSLDRIVEHEWRAVLACVGAQKTCGDPVWAACATRIGAHADGGPPAPPPPVED